MNNGHDKNFHLKLTNLDILKFPTKVSCPLNVIVDCKNFEVEIEKGDCSVVITEKDIQGLKLLLSTAEGYFKLTREKQNGER